MDSKTRIIFLSVDGVLNSRPYYVKSLNNYISNKKYANNKIEDISTYYLKNLAKIYHRYPDTKIILSSFYNCLFGGTIAIEYIKKRLSEYNMQIFDVTPDTDSEGKRFITYPQEIDEWLKIHPEINYWVSLDSYNDEDAYKSANKHLWTHLCKCEVGNKDDNIKECGLSLVKTHIALEILGGKYE